MVKFRTPPVGMLLSEYMELSDLMQTCSSCSGFCISLGRKFFEEGIKEVDTRITPELSAALEDGVSPRVLPSYSILFWFALQVCYSFAVNLVFKYPDIPRAPTFKVSISVTTIVTCSQL